MSTDRSAVTWEERKERKRQEMKGKEKKGDRGSKVTFHLRNSQKTIHLFHTHGLLEWSVLRFVIKKVDEIFTSSYESRAAVLSAPLQKLEVHRN